MTGPELRQVLRGMYASQKWRDRVEKMSDKQMFAIYARTMNHTRKVK